tara:strand:+ start:11818 stop:12069 length:252 start_codon:yes stop_codon:yes gene_type:complete
MSVCAVQIGNSIELTTETVCSEFVLLSQSDLLSLESGSLEQMNETLHMLFAFDPEVFAIVEGALILAFLTSHYGGRIVRWLGK